MIHLLTPTLQPPTPSYHPLDTSYPTRQTVPAHFLPPQHRQLQPPWPIHALYRRLLQVWGIDHDHSRNVDPPASQTALPEPTAHADAAMQQSALRTFQQRQVLTHLPQTSLNVPSQQPVPLPSQHQRVKHTAQVPRHIMKSSSSFVSSFSPPLATHRYIDSDACSHVDAMVNCDSVVSVQVNGSNHSGKGTQESAYNMAAAVLSGIP